MNQRSKGGVRGAAVVAMVGPRARLLGLLVASPLLGPAPDPPVGCDHPAFRVYDR